LVAIWFFIILFELFIISKIVKYFLLSPVYIYIIFAIVSIIASVWYFYDYSPKFDLYHIDEISEKYFFEIIKKYMLALIYFMLGVIFYYDTVKRKSKLVFNRSFTHTLFVNINIDKKYIKYAAFLVLFIFGLYIFVYGKYIFVRKGYLIDVSKGFTLIIKVLTFLTSAFLGLTYKKNRIKSLVLFLLLMSISIGTGSRSVFLAVMVFIVVKFIAGGNNLRNKISFGVNIFLSFIFLSFLMNLRSLHAHGVIPYLKNIYEVKDFGKSIFFNLYYSLIYGVFITAQTLKHAVVNWHIIFTNINPLPGRFTDWYQYAAQMRLNIYAPFSLHGRVFTMGGWFTFLYFFITGIIFADLEKRVRRLLEKNKRIVAFMIVLLLALHIVYGFEYNMRSAIRYIYYSYLLLLMIYIFKEFKKMLIVKNTDNATQ